jgi:hypothetical protein
MPNAIDIDSRHSRAIVREIGERLQSSFKVDRELPASFRTQIERLRQLEDGATLQDSSLKTTAQWAARRRAARRR